MSKANTAKYVAMQRAITDGRVVVDRDRGCLIGKRGMPIGRVTPLGYVVVKIPRGYWHNDAVLYAHRVIWESAHGVLPADLQINHKNGVKTDNRIANLEVVTGSQNTKHAMDTGLSTTQGESHPNATLTNEAVLAVYARAWAGESMKELAAEFGATYSTIRSIKSGRWWRRVTGHVTASKKAA